MMNKKFLKTILFGGLFLSLTGAFVSCAEDYSDDIQNLQTQITTNSNAIAELQALLAKGYFGAVEVEPGLVNFCATERISAEQVNYVVEALKEAFQNKEA